MGENTLKAYSQAAPTYDAEPNSVLFAETETVLALLALRHGDRFLDAACGTGKYAAEAAALGATVTGLDFSPEMLALAAAKCPAGKFLRHDLMSGPLPFPDGAFDRVVLAHALWHLAGIAGIFSEFARVLARGGRLIVSVTHPEAAFKRFSYRAEDLPGGEETDLGDEKRRYSRAEIEEAARAAGLVPAGAEIIPVDERLRGILTAGSYDEVLGTPLILALRFDKT